MNPLAPNEQATPSFTPNSATNLVQSLLHHAPGLVILLGRGYELLQWNEAAGAILRLCHHHHGKPLHAITSFCTEGALATQLPACPPTSELKGSFSLGAAGFLFTLLPVNTGAGGAFLLMAQPAAGYAPANPEVLQQLSIEGAEQGTFDWDILSGAVGYNARWAQMRGYALHEIQPTVGFFLEGIHPDDRAGFDDALSQYFEGQTAYYEAEFRVRTREGQWIWIQGRGKIYQRDAAGKPIRMAGVEMEITQRKEAELAVRASEQKLKTILNCLPDCLKIVNTEGEVVEMNPAGLGLTGARSVADFASFNLAQMILPAYREQFFRQHARALEGQQSEIEFEAIDMAGRHKWIHSYCVPFYDPNNRITATLFISRDITGNKQKMERINTLNRELDLLNTHLQEVREFERRRIAMEVHEELGQRLAALKFSITKARRGATEALDAFLENALVQTSNLADIIRQVSVELHPVLLRDLGLPAALEKLGADHQQRTGTPVALRLHSGTPQPLYKSALLLYRCCEALLHLGQTEPWKCNRIHIRMRHRNKTLQLACWLNAACETYSSGADLNSEGGFLAIREQVRHLQGTLSHIRGPRGLLVKLSLPLG